MASFPAFNPGSAIEADDDGPLFLSSFSKLFNGFWNPNTAAVFEDGDDSWDNSHLFPSLLSPKANNTIKISDNVHRGTPETSTSTVVEDLIPESGKHSIARKNTAETVASTDDTSSVASPVQNALDGGNMEVYLSPLPSPNLDDGSDFHLEHEDTTTSAAEREAEIEEIISHINNEFVEKLSAEAAAELDAQIDAILESADTDIIAAIHSYIENDNPVEIHNQVDSDEGDDVKINAEDADQTENKVVQDIEVIADFPESGESDDDFENELESLPDFTEVLSNEIFTPARVLFPTKFRIVPMEVTAETRIEKRSRSTLSSITRVLTVTAIHTVVHCGLMSAGMRFVGMRSS